MMVMRVLTMQATNDSLPLCLPKNQRLVTATLNEKALALIRWQPRQWQAIVSSGCSSILNRIWPQRHPPTRGKPKSAMTSSFCCDLNQ